MGIISHYLSGTFPQRNHAVAQAHGAKLRREEAVSSFSPQRREGGIISAPVFENTIIGSDWTRNYRF